MSSKKRRTKRLISFDITIYKKLEEDAANHGGRTITSLVNEIIGKYYEKDSQWKKEDWRDLRMGEQHE